MKNITTTATDPVAAPTINTINKHINPKLKNRKNQTQAKKTEDNLIGKNEKRSFK